MQAVDPFEQAVSDAWFWDRWRYKAGVGADVGLAIAHKTLNLFAEGGETIINRVGGGAQVLSNIASDVSELDAAGTWEVTKEGGEGLWHGSIMLTHNALDIGTLGNSPLQDRVNRLVAENGPGYALANMAGRIGLEAGFTALTLGTSNILRAGEAGGYAARTLTAAKIAQPFFTAREGIQTFQGGVATFQAIREGDVAGALFHGTTTILGGIGFAGSARQSYSVLREAGSSVRRGLQEFIATRDWQSLRSATAYSDPFGFGIVSHFLSKGSGRASRQAVQADLLEQVGMRAASRIPPGNVQADEAFVYALFKEGKLFRYGETNDPARRLLEHVQRFGPVQMKVISEALAKPIAVARQNEYIDRYVRHFGRMPPGNPIRS